MEHICSLCGSETELFTVYRNKNYFYCNTCQSVQLDRNEYLSKENELSRYNLHNNDVLDVNYQRFVMPIVNYITQNFAPHHRGLDYGCGPGPVVKKLLAENNYQVKLYDPYFHNNQEALDSNYDYIILSEVAEHFYEPKYEFSKLKSLLKPDGALIIMTLLYNPGIDFPTWRYKDDETHVFFYSKTTFDYIKASYGFRDLIIDNRLIILQN